jgi:hypothetical protein
MSKDLELGDIEDAIAAAQAAADQARCAYDARVGKRRVPQDKAAAARTEVTRLEEEHQRVRERLALGDAGAEDELFALDASIARAQRLAVEYEAAARLLDPSVDELGPGLQTAQQAVYRAEYDRTWLLAFRAAGRLEAQFEAIIPTIVAFLAADEAREQAHREAFGDRSSLDPPGARVARFAFNWLRGAVGQPHNTLFGRGDFPAGCESISTPLKAHDRRTPRGAITHSGTAPDPAGAPSE